MKKERSHLSDEKELFSYLYKLEYLHYIQPETNINLESFQHGFLYIDQLDGSFCINGLVQEVKQNSLIFIPANFKQKKIITFDKGLSGYFLSFNSLLDQGNGIYKATSLKLPALLDSHQSAHSFVTNARDILELQPQHQLKANLYSKSGSTHF